MPAIKQTHTRKPQTLDSGGIDSRGLEEGCRLEHILGG